MIMITLPLRPCRADTELTVALSSLPDAVHVEHEEPLHRLPAVARHFDRLPHRLPAPRRRHRSRLRSPARGHPTVRGISEQEG